MRTECGLQLEVAGKLAWGLAHHKPGRRSTLPAFMHVSILENLIISSRKDDAIKSSASARVAAAVANVPHDRIHVEIAWPSES